MSFEMCCRVQRESEFTIKIKLVIKTRFDNKIKKHKEIYIKHLLSWNEDEKHIYITYTIVNAKSKEIISELTKKFEIFERKRAEYVVLLIEQKFKEWQDRDCEMLDSDEINDEYNELLREIND